MFDLSLTPVVCRRTRVLFTLFVFVFTSSLFVGGLVSYLHYLCLFVYNGVQHMLCCVFVLVVFVFCLLPVSLDCPFLITPSIFSLEFILPNFSEDIACRYAKMV